MAFRRFRRLLLPGALPPRRFQELKGTLVSVETVERATQNGFRTETLVLTGSSGLTLRGHLRFPEGASFPLPAFVFLGGLDRAKRETLERLAGDRPVLWASIEYPYRLPRKRGFLSHLTEAPRMFVAIEQSVAGVLLLLDHLASRVEADSSRLIVGGASLGGYLAVIAGAVDPRPSAVVTLFGGGDLPRIVEKKLKIRSPRLRKAAVTLLRRWLDPVDPLHYASRLAPRPFLMVNGLSDTVVPARCVRALFEAAGERKTLRWLDTPHTVIHDPELIDRVSEVVFAWLEDVGVIARSTPSALRTRSLVSD